MTGLGPLTGVIGHARACALLEAELKRTGGAGSTLLCGPEGVGRFRLALAAARAILGDTPAAAGKVDRMLHPDLHLLLPEAGIDGVRDAQVRLAHRAAEGPRPVLIARDADRLSTEAQNALLKTLEEPPADAALFLVAESPAFMPETVVSRCRLITLDPLSEADTRRVLEQEGAAPEAAQHAGGSPGRALYRLQAGVPEAAEQLLLRMQDRAGDPLGGLDTLLKKRSEESGAEHRRRLIETLHVVGERLRSGLPEAETRLRTVLKGLGSLRRNGNPSVVFTHVLLQSWRNPEKKDPGKR